MRLVHWNVAGGLGQGTREILHAYQADLYILSEIPDPPSVEVFRAELGSCYRSEVFGNLAVIAAGPVRAEGWLIDRRRTKVQSVTWVRAKRAVTLLVVDLPSEIGVHRDPLLREVNGLIEGHRPDLVVGDFNAPRRSWALCSLPDGYRHAYDAVGGGCGYTWPVPVPMYAIDQCIHSLHIVPKRYSLSSSSHSDHRIQIFDFSLSPAE